jgi:hypothetical protein
MDFVPKLPNSIVPTVKSRHMLAKHVPRLPQLPYRLDTVKIALECMADSVCHAVAVLLAESDWTELNV